LNDVDLDKIISVSLGPGTRQKACRAMDQASCFFAKMSGAPSDRAVILPWRSRAR
jgi:hypothetical protein